MPLCKSGGFDIRSGGFCFVDMNGSFVPLHQGIPNLIVQQKKFSYVTFIY